jgi:hypothetical protein
MNSLAKHVWWWNLAWGRSRRCSWVAHSRQLLLLLNAGLEVVEVELLWQRQQQQQRRQQYK